MNNQYSQLPEINERTLPVKLESADLFIFAAGFEERSLFFPSNVEAAPGAHALVLHYTPDDTRNQTTLAVQIVEKAGITTEVVEFNRMDADEAWNKLWSSIAKKRQTHHRIILDISGLSKIGILLAMEAARLEDFILSVLYAEAQSYKPSQDEYATARAENNILRPSLQIYSGVENVLCATSLSSVAMQGQPICLVTFMSFNENFIQTLLNRLSPSRLILINGRPPCHTWREEATAWIHERLLNEWAAHERKCGGTPINRVTSTLDYRETVSELSQIYWENFTSHRMIISPCGSKMQAVGTYLSKAIHQDIHIEYPVARGYLDQYSYRVGPIWELNLGRLSELVSNLREADTQANMMI